MGKPDDNAPDVPVNATKKSMKKRGKKKKKSKASDAHLSTDEKLRRELQRQTQELVIRLRAEGKAEEAISAAKSQLKGKFWQSPYVADVRRGVTPDTTKDQATTEEAGKKKGEKRTSTTTEQGDSIPVEKKKKKKSVEKEENVIEHEGKKARKKESKPIEEDDDVENEPVVKKKKKEKKTVEEQEENAIEKADGEGKKSKKKDKKQSVEDVEDTTGETSKKADKENKHRKTEEGRTREDKKAFWEDAKKSNKTVALGSQHDIVVIPVSWRGRHDHLKIVEAAQKVKEILAQQGLDTWVDGRRQYTPGQKFAYWEHLGLKYRVEVGPEDLENNVCKVCKHGEPGDYKAVQKVAVPLPPKGAKRLLVQLKRFGMEKLEAIIDDGKDADESDDDNTVEAPVASKKRERESGDSMEENFVLRDKVEKKKKKKH